LPNLSVPALHLFPRLRERLNHALEMLPRLLGG